MKRQPSSLRFSNVLQILGAGRPAGKNQRHIIVWMEVDQIVSKRRIHILSSVVLSCAFRARKLNSGGKWRKQTGI